MNKRLQTDESHFVSFIFPKFLTNWFSLHNIALPIFVSVFLLGAPSSELFAQQKSAAKSEQKPSVEIPKSTQSGKAISLQYEKSSFKTTDEGIIKPVVSVLGGTFTVERLDADSKGSLAFNNITGWIIPKFSNPGTYRITYQFEKHSASTTLIVK